MIRQNHLVLTIIFLLGIGACVSAQEIHTQSNAVSLSNESNSVSGWTYGNTSVTVETNDVYEGQYAIKFEAAADGWRTGKYTFQTTAGVQYHISIHAKVVNSDNAGFWMWKGFSDFDGGQNIAPGGWNKYDFIYTGDGTLAELLVYTGHPSVTGNAILIDAVSIVPYVAVTGVDIASSNPSVSVGNSTTVVANILPSSASNKDVYWTSSNPSIATVDSQGNVNGLSVGSTTLTATTAEGSFVDTVSFSVTESSNNSTSSTHANYLNGLISSYSFESAGAFMDEIGNNNGTISGATVADGSIGNALAFNGTQSTMVTIPSSESLDLDGSELSFMVDIYPTANGQSGVSVILQKGVQDQGNNIYSVSYNSSNKIRFRNFINGTQRDFISTTSAPLNTWSRILCVWKSGEPKIIRINSATDIDANAYSGTQSVSSGRDLTVGSYDVASPATTRSFTGRIDNLMIWNRALTTEEQDVLINQNLGFSDFNSNSNNTGGSTGNGLWTSNGDAIYNLDNVAIGRNTVPTGYKLAVDGHIRAREIKVDAAAWPDYVFDKEYKLLSLEQIKKHILEKGHLPNIPSAAEMEANGVELGGMNKLLLEKIEELTLHLIEQNKRIEKLNKEIINKEK